MMAKPGAGHNFSLEKEFMWTLTRSAYLCKNNDRHGQKATLSTVHPYVEQVMGAASNLVTGRPPVDFSTTTSSPSGRLYSYPG
jgi:hypothetical protein